MAQLGDKLVSAGNNRIGFWCPGCGEIHIVEIGKWTWNGDPVRPTFSPSILVTSGHYVPGHDGGSCWCTYNREHAAAPAPFKCESCHSFITDGAIQFLGDSTHALAGRTVDVPPLPAHLVD